ncbi:MAG TPA: molybdopterin-binding protein, partial [Polyangiaceae bacterium]|nr:molybdopterin-binding protein [Polyangiaceae bacterium]
MSAAILAIGTEITRGEIVNTNASWLADTLVGLGLEVTAMEAIPDDKAQIVATLRRLSTEHQLILCTGGLGPTTDDMTSECVATLLGVPLVRDAMLAETASAPIDLFVHVGDMAYDDGTTAELTSNFFDVYADVLRSVPVWPAIGNHEGHTADSATQSGPYYDAYVLPFDGSAGGEPSGTEAY